MKRIDGLVIHDPATLALPLRLAVGHASATRRTTSAFLFRVSRGAHRGYGEAAPRPYVTGETLDGATAAAMRLAAALPTVRTFDDLVAASERLGPEIDRAPAAWCAVELALLDLLGREAGQPVEAVVGLGVEPTTIRYAAALPRLRGRSAGLAARIVGACGFADVKVRPSGDADADLALVARFTARGLRVRLDGNGHWSGRPEQALRDLAPLAVHLAAVEEPGARSDREWYPRLARELGVCVVLDESFTARADLDVLGAFPPGRVAVNLKVAKVGGLVRAMALARAAAARGVVPMIGAMVGETSLLTRAGQVLARSLPAAPLAHEGGVGHWLVRDDPFTPVQTFGRGGRMTVAPARLGTGFGLTVRAPYRIEGADNASQASAAPDEGGTPAGGKPRAV